jgi:hypothetical protein
MILVSRNSTEKNGENLLEKLSDYQYINIFLYTTWYKMNYSWGKTYLVAEVGEQQSFCETDYGENDLYHP